MLRRIMIKNYALIENLEIELDEGLNVITGETGAGKSIIIDAISLLIGQRGNKENIRAGAEKMIVQGEFDLQGMSVLLQLLSEMGIEAEDGQLVLLRSIDRNGRNSCRANGTLVTVTQLKEMGPFLIDIHSQHEHNRLFSATSHRLLLDDFGGDPVRKLLTETEEGASKLKVLREELLTLERDSRELEREKALLEHTVQEITTADLKPGEDTELENQKLFLANREKIFDRASAASRLLSGNDTDEGNHGILAELSDFLEKLRFLAEIDKSFLPALAATESAEVELRSFFGELTGYLDRIDFEPGALDATESRLAEIASLKRRYGNTLEDIIQAGEKAAEKLARLSGENDTKNKLKQEYIKVWDGYKKAAHTLCDLRQTTAVKLKAKLEGELHDLAMEKAQIVVNIDSDEKRISSTGQDHVEFLISVNPGVAPQGIRKVASGGEISRIMLALKSLFAEEDPGMTMIFDEIDTGISGRTAQKVAEKIEKISRSHQLICITHLPQIAAMTDRHFRVVKDTQKSQTEVCFSILSDDERTEELARMLSGAEVTRLSRENAEEMIALSRKMKG